MFKDAITNMVPVGVVNRFEAVYIGKREHKRIPVPLAHNQLPVD